MSDTLSLRLCKVLCANGGSMERGQLSRALGLSSGQMSRLLEAERGRSLVTRSQGGHQLCVYVSPLRVCADRNQECTGDCETLHLCRFYTLGGCSRSHCKFNHSLDSDQVTRELQRRHLLGVTITELRHLLLQNDPNLLPDVCSHYNRGEGPHGSCTFGAGCSKLHLCGHLLQGDCRFGDRCRRCHDLGGDDTIRKLLKWGLSAGAVPLILEAYLNASAIRTPRPPEKSSGATDQRGAQKPTTEEICLYFISHSCSFKERCTRDHYHLPYRWQLCADDTWKDFAAMENIERAYCDPNTRNTVEHLDFDTMMYKTYKVRRLSTPSSVTKPPHYILTTDWLWYWKDERNTWNEYGRQANDHEAATITSRDLESAFQSDGSRDIGFRVGSRDYLLSLRDMTQRNTRFATQRPVCRRPAFVSAEDVKKMKTRRSDAAKLGNDKSTPPHWKKGPVPEAGYKLVLLSESCEEYKTVAAMFHRTLDLRIRGIQRIQNPALWEVYQWQRGQMKKQSGAGEVDERQLFHGTSGTLVDAICQQNFDWRICGAHGTAYGKGSYFARDASYSHQYSSRDGRHHYVLFVARVLVGDFTRGSSAYLRPPAKPSSPSRFYDSCVDRERDPAIFVLFEKHQVYPEYIIRYSP